MDGFLFLPDLFVQLGQGESEVPCPSLAERLFGSPLKLSDVCAYVQNHDQNQGVVLLWAPVGSVSNVCSDSTDGRYLHKMLNIERFCLYNLERSGVQMDSAGHNFCFALHLLSFMALNLDVRVCYSIHLAVEVMGMYVEDHVGRGSDGNTE